MALFVRGQLNSPQYHMSERKKRYDIWGYVWQHLISLPHLKKHTHLIDGANEHSADDNLMYGCLKGANLKRTDWFKNKVLTYLLAFLLMPF